MWSIGRRLISAVPAFPAEIRDFSGMFLAFLAKRAGTRAVTGGTSSNPPND
jgi:hypothetical protein